ncbi:MAG TPA: hypothetical protein VH595_10575 [Verrucomicrobiae bacterium]|nr:hypothetical protein [Verrucomicrobiae bacterium]
MKKRAAERKWLFRLGAFMLVPALFLLALEGSLRMCGYGYPTGFFSHLQVGAKNIW